jgi:hypothetical protein
MRLKAEQCNWFGILILFSWLPSSPESNLASMFFQLRAPIWNVEESYGGSDDRCNQSDNEEGAAH